MRRVSARAKAPSQGGNTVVVNRRAGALVDSVLGTLVPGENDVPTEKWMERTNPKGDGFSKQVGAWLDCGYLVVKPGAKKALPAVENLGLVTDAEKAVALVKGCTNASLLRKWATNDSRSVVQRAIIDRLAVLEGQGVEPEEPEEPVAEAEPDAEEAPKESEEL